MKYNINICRKTFFSCMNYKVVENFGIFERKYYYFNKWFLFFGGDLELLRVMFRVIKNCTLVLILNLIPATHFKKVRVRGATKTWKSCVKLKKKNHLVEYLTNM